ncbi:hypothetical protein J8A87_23265 [Vibrio parahaemolyticus]|nr:hypothetical protein [Vibrio parahaemolyticus]
MESLVDNSKRKVPCFIDEFSYSKSEQSAYYRMRMLLTLTSNGWNVGEAFNDRYMTIVGGNCAYLTMEKDGQTHTSYSERESSIFDSVENISYSSREAENIPALHSCLARLRERESEYEKHKETH